MLTAAFASVGCAAPPGLGEITDGRPVAGAPSTTVAAPPASATTSPSTTAVAREYTPEEIGVRFGDSVWRVEVTGCGVASTGSAFAVAEDLLITNEHVVRFDMQPIVVDRNGRELQGQVIGMRTDPDIAVIRVDGAVGEPLQWRPAAELNEGQTLVAVGYPLPLGNFSVAPGTLLSFEVERGERIAIVSDESSDYGSSGGPLFDSTGRVVGVVTEFTEDLGKQVTGLSYTYEYVSGSIDEIVAEPEQLETFCDGVGLDYGSVWYLDVLWDLCEEGRDWACDVLFNLSESGSEYARFGSSCGDRLDTAQWCTDAFGTAVPDDYGSDAYLDRRWDLCESDSSLGPEACDELFMIAPPGSRYEDFGFSCGDRFIDPDDFCIDLVY